MASPKKRKLDSVEPENRDKRTMNPPPKRSNRVYFKDGNIMLIADNIAFRVHKSILALHSDVFRNMFEDVNQPADAEVFEGCPVVRLSDERDALETFLNALYMIEPISHHDPEEAGVYFPHVLRLATKYLCNTIRRQALDVFCGGYYPDTLSGWDTRDSSLASEYIIDLARDIKAEILLPAAFYELCRYSNTRNEVNPDDVVTYFVGKAKIGAFWPKFLKDQIDLREEPPCEHLLCTIAWREFWDKKALEALGICQTAGMDPLSQLKKCSKDFDVVKGACLGATLTMKNLCDMERVKIWNELPEIFGLGSWEELRAATDDLSDEHVESRHSSAVSSGYEE